MSPVLLHNDNSGVAAAEKNTSLKAATMGSDSKGQNRV
jgi:hypothetical protein